MLAERAAERASRSRFYNTVPRERVDKWYIFSHVAADRHPRVGTGMSGGRGVPDFCPQICHCRRKVILGKSLSVRTVLVPITSARSTPVLRTTRLLAFSADGGSENLWE